MLFAYPHSVDWGPVGILYITCTARTTTHLLKEEGKEGFRVQLLV